LVAFGPCLTTGGLGFAVETDFSLFGWMASTPTPPVRSPCAAQGRAEPRHRSAASAAEAIDEDAMLFFSLMLLTVGRRLRA